MCIQQLTVADPVCARASVRQLPVVGAPRRINKSDGAAAGCSCVNTLQRWAPLSPSQPACSLSEEQEEQEEAGRDISAVAAAHGGI